MASYKCVDKGESGLASKRTGNHPKLAQLIVALPCNQIDMMRKSELRIKHDTEVADTSRECYAGEERGRQPENNLHSKVDRYLDQECDNSKCKSNDFKKCFTACFLFNVQLSHSLVIIPLEAIGGNSKIIHKQVRNEAG